MLKNSISYQDTQAFSNTILDYIANAEKLKPFLGNYSDLAGFKKQISAKEKQNLSSSHREVLVTVLKKQYNDINTTTLVKSNIELLLSQNTFTITTGHQLNLFSGPLYFLYKIISAINLSKQLKEAFPNANFVPIYWMASEDHDFEEIQYFNSKNHQIKWERKAQGAVGKLSTEGLDKALNEFKKILGTTDFDNELLALFKASYLEHKTLAKATLHLANALFKDYGLVILDAHNKALKEIFSPYIKNELVHQTCFKTVSKTINALKTNYKIQVNPREINLFYLQDNLRERIIYKNEQYYINNTNLVFSQAGILDELANHPEYFSPNVLMRPLYQEVILPNLCYIGGGGELAYWLELKAYFEANNVLFPIYLLRNTALIITKKQSRQLEKLGITQQELFLNKDTLISKKVKEYSSNCIDFNQLQATLSKQFDSLEKAINNTDKSFSGAVSAEKNRQLNSLKKLEKRYYKAEKKRLKTTVSKVEELKEELFPNGSLQERNQNFSIFYSLIGKKLIKLLAENLEPLQLDFNILTLKE